MPNKPEPKREIVRRNTKPRERPPAQHPCDVPEGATHFKLRKGGSAAPACRAANANGVEVEFHPIEAFDVNRIARSWGYDSDYWVQFSRRVADGKRTNLGASRRFGMHDPHELAADGIEVEGGTVLPAASSGAPSLDSPAFALFQAFRAESSKEVAAGIEREQRRMDAQQSMVMSIVQTFAPRPSTGVDPVLAAILERMSEQAATTNALMAQILADRVEDPDPPDDPEPAELTDDEKVEEFKKLYRNKGAVAAFSTMMGEETAESVFRLIPKIKARLPDVVAKLGPMLQAQLTTLLEAPAPPPAKVAPRMVTSVKPKAAAAPAPEVTVK